MARAELPLVAAQVPESRLGRILPRSVRKRPSRPVRTSPARSAAAATRESRTTARQHLDRRGHGRGEPGGHDREAPNSFIYRYVPKHPGDLANGKLQVLQVLNAAGSRSRSSARRRSTRPTRWRCTPTARRFKTRWVTIHDTAADGTAPFNANTLAKAAEATPFKRPENGAFRPGSQLPRVLLRRDRRHQRDQPRERRPPAAGARSSSSPRASPSADTGTLDAVLQGRRGARRLRQRRRSSRATRSRSSRTRATRCTASATRSTRLGPRRDDATTRSRRTSRSAGSPRAATRRRRSTPPTAASARTRATTRSPASTSPTATRAPDGILGAKVAEPRPRRLALVLHPAARRQPDLRGRSRAQRGDDD